MPAPRTRRGARSKHAMPVRALSAFLSLTSVFVAPPVTHARDLATYGATELRPKTPGLQMALYKFYSPLYSVPDLDGRRPDLVVRLDAVDQSNTTSDRSSASRGSSPRPSPRASTASTAPCTAEPLRRAHHRPDPGRALQHVRVRAGQQGGRETLDRRRAAREQRLQRPRDAGAPTRPGGTSTCTCRRGTTTCAWSTSWTRRWSQLRLWQSGLGLPGRIAPKENFFLPDETQAVYVCLRLRPVPRGGLRNRRGGVLVAERGAAAQAAAAGGGRWRVRGTVRRLGGPRRGSPTSEKPARGGVVTGVATHARTVSTCIS